MPAYPPKQTLKDELVQIIAADLEARERAHRATREAATHEEAKPENDKDTRALEQSYLARGEALRIEELRAGLAEVTALALRPFAEGAPAALSALVVAEEDDAEVALWLAPFGGGNKLAGDRVQVVTPKSPLGRALLGKRVGDECEIALAKATRVLRILALTTFAFSALALAGCTRFGAVYPPRPTPSLSPPAADPVPSRVVAHVSMTSAALKSALEDSIPRAGDGTFTLLASERRYAWDRGALDLGFSQGRITLDTRVTASVAIPLHAMTFPLDVHVVAEPILSGEYAVKLQSVEVKVTSPDQRLAIADTAARIYDKLAATLTTQLRAFTYDFRSLLAEAESRIAQPIDVPVGDTHACAELRVLGIEAGPTVLADGIEKDVALIVSPSVTLPCERTATSVEEAPSLPPLQNVAGVPSGPFTLTVPIAARYDELTRAMSVAFTDGKLFFSPDYPGLFLEKPELYESQGELVLKLHLQGPVHKLGIDADLDGDLFLSGHPAVVDNELQIPDLEPTIETKNFLLSLKAMSDGDRIRDQARQALRLDIGDRLRPIREKLSSDLTFGSAQGCFHGDVDRIAVTGVHLHASYLRVYVEVTARARAMVPCGVAMPAPPSASTPGP